MTAWINAYQTSCAGATIDYQANGTGAGIKDFINKQTAFAGCAGVPLGTLSSFGGSCGFYDASQLGGGQLGWGTGFGGGMLLGSGTFG